MEPHLSSPMFLILSSRQKQAWVSLPGSHVCLAPQGGHTPFSFGPLCLDICSFIWSVSVWGIHRADLTRFFFKCVSSEDLPGKLQSFITPLSVESRGGWSSCTLDRRFSGIQLDSHASVHLPHEESVVQRRPQSPA